MAQKNERVNWIISEVAFYALLYYIQVLLRVQAKLWLSTLVLWVLINAAIIFCPVVRRCYR